MTPLERHCRLLLRAYPVTYRQDRGEEIIGTLLQATPASRSWPLARDVRGLAVGGLRARAALNRRRTTAANLRIAVLVGATAYLAFSAANELSFAVLSLTGGTLRHNFQTALPPLVVGGLGGLAVTVTWLSSRRAVQIAAVIPAAVAATLAGPWRLWMFWPVSELACLAALALLAGRVERPRRRWLWPVALVAVFPLVGYLVPEIWPFSILGLLEAMAAIAVLWVVIDARPAVAATVFLLALFLPSGIQSLAIGDIPSGVPLLVVAAMAAFAGWRLHRQSARVTADREK